MEEVNENQIISIIHAPNLQASIGNIVTEDIYGNRNNNNNSNSGMSTSFSQSQTVRTESKSIETIPVNTRDLSIQSIIPQMKDVSSQMQHSMMKDHGIQINPELRDKGSSTNNNNYSMTNHSEESTSYSYSNNNNNNNSMHDNSGTRFRVDSSRVDPAIGILIRVTPERNNSVDYSTTLIKDINLRRAQQQFEPVELIVNR